MMDTITDMISRPRRNRRSSSVRSLLAETQLSVNDFVYPLFIHKSESCDIESMPGQRRLSEKDALLTIETAMNLGIHAFALFPAIEDNLKDRRASEGKNPQGLLPRTIDKIKKRFPEACLFSDVAMDPYSSDGHDGLVENGEILNDPSLEILAQMALVQADAGTDYVSPSDMMDGRIGFIRQALDENGFQSTGIMSYSAKYASAFYGPFRDALDSAPKAGDKKTYQMDPANAIEAIREVELDLGEGADIVMVKPALAYLDIIASVRENCEVPVAAYNVSGEYAMIKAAANRGWLDERSTTLEKLLSIKRAGASLIFSYHAVEAAGWLKEEL